MSETTTPVVAPVTPPVTQAPLAVATASGTVSGAVVGLICAYLDYREIKISQTVPVFLMMIVTPIVHFIALWMQKESPPGTPVLMSANKRIPLP